VKFVPTNIGSYARDALWNWKMQKSYILRLRANGSPNLTEKIVSYWTNMVVISIVLIVMGIVVFVWMLRGMCGRHRAFRRGASVDCVISACGNQADVEYTKRVVRESYGPDVRFYVYNKCGSVPGSIPLPNLGREQHTYAHHVSVHFNNMAEYVIFTPANIKGQRPVRERTLREAATWRNKHGFYCSKKRETFGFLSDWDHSGPYQGRTLDPATPRGVRNWAEYHIGMYASDETPSCGWGTFVTTSELIRETPRETFAHVARQLATKEPEAGHYMEKIVPLLYAGRTVKRIQQR
tara:strand:+ start:1301 stop:2182 length:882 start_codon:yes stop_codon:yes gene_type:complete